jgi:hypothetical protein
MFYTFLTTLDYIGATMKKIFMLCLLLVAGMPQVYAIDLPAMLLGQALTENDVVYNEIKGTELRRVFVRAPARTTGSVLQFFDPGVWEAQVNQESFVGKGVDAQAAFLSAVCSARENGWWVYCRNAQEASTIPVNTDQLFVPIATVHASNIAATTQEILEKSSIYLQYKNATTLGHDRKPKRASYTKRWSPQPIELELGERVE